MSEEPSNPEARWRRWLTGRAALTVLIVVWLWASYAKARIYTDSAWGAIGAVVLGYGLVGVLTWAWIFGGKLREREEQREREQRGRHDPPAI